MKSDIDPDYLKQIRQEFGSQLVEYRMRKNLSQRALADQVGTTQRSIVKMERGDWSFSIDALMIMASHLDFTISIQSRSPLEDLLKSIRTSRGKGYVTANPYKSN